MHLSEVQGAEPPDANEFMEIWEEKSMETCNFWKILMEILASFQFFQEVYGIFPENCAITLGNYENMHL